MVLKRGEIPGREIEEMVDRQLHGPRRQSADDRTRFLRKPYACPKTSIWHASLQVLASRGRMYPPISAGAVLRSANRNAGHWRQVCDLVGDAAEQQCCEIGKPLGAADHEVRTFVGNCLDDLLGRIAFQDQTADFVCALCFQFLLCLPDNLLSQKSENSVGTRLVFSEVEGLRRNSVLVPQLEIRHLRGRSGPCRRFKITTSAWRSCAGRSRSARHAITMGATRH